jgi:hypothetical protein
MSLTIDLTRKKFGRWTVLSRDRNAPAGQARWRCRCKCGTERTITGQALRTRNSRSCGCLNRELVIKQSTKHGHATGGISSTYHTWAGMIARCSSPANDAYADYGGRGIRVCERWSDFRKFLKDMGTKPSGKCLRRRDRDGGFASANCYWGKLPGGPGGRR